MFQAGAGTSQNMNVNEVIANRANEIVGTPKGTYKFIHPNDDVNCSQSTNDVIPTAIRLAALQEIKTFLPVFDQVIQSFRTKETEFKKKYHQSLKRTGSQTHARLNVQRHILAVLYGMFKRMEEYKPFNEEKTNSNKNITD